MQRCQLRCRCIDNSTLIDSKFSSVKSPGVFGSIYYSCHLTSKEIIYFACLKCRWLHSEGFPSVPIVYFGRLNLLAQTTSFSKHRDLDFLILAPNQALPFCIFTKFPFFPSKNCLCAKGSPTPPTSSIELVPLKQLGIFCRKSQHRRPILHIQSFFLFFFLISWWTRGNFLPPSSLWRWLSWSVAMPTACSRGPPK